MSTTTTSPGGRAAAPEPFDHLDPRQFIADFHQRFHDAVVGTDDDLAAIVDRFHTPDIVQVADGNPMDRDKLIAHLAPIRRTAPSTRIEVLDALVEGDRLAVRYRMYVERPGADETIDRLVITVHAFNRYAADGRLHRADILTRMDRGRLAGTQAPTGSQAAP